MCSIFQSNLFHYSISVPYFIYILSISVGPSHLYVFLILLLLTFFTRTHKPRIYSLYSRTMSCREAVAQLDAKLREERKRADDQALYYAGLFLLYADKIDKVICRPFSTLRRQYLLSNVCTTQAFSYSTWTTLIR